MSTHGAWTRVKEVASACKCVTSYGGAWEHVFVEVEIFGHYWGAWLRVSMFLGLKFSGFVHFKPWKTLVWSVFWNLEHISIDLKEESVISEACGHAWRRVFAPVSLIFQGFVNRSPFNVPVGSVLWNKVWIFINLEDKVVGDNLSMMTFLFFFAGGSDKAAPVLRLKGQKVGDELPFSVWHLSFQPLVQSPLILSAECCELAKSDFKLQLFSHFWNVNEDFSTSRLVDPFNSLLTFFIFLVG